MGSKGQRGTDGENLVNSDRLPHKQHDYQRQKGCRSGYLGDCLRLYLELVNASRPLTHLCYPCAGTT